MLKYLFKLKLRYNLLLILLFVILLYSTPSLASSYDLEINKYDVNIIVNEDNSYLINETLQVEFNKIDMHGIFRDIPTETYFGKPVKIKNLNVTTHDYSSERNGSFLSLRIGDADIYVNPMETYNISYLYTIGDDTNTEMDEFYFNIVGSQWEIPIHNTTFSVAMPKSFDATNLNITSGYLGSTDSSEVTYFVDGNTITGELNRTLNPGESLTVALPLPEMYFSDVTPDGVFLKTLTSYYNYIFPALLLLVALLWFRFGRDEKIYPPVEFYPPTDLTPAEIGYIYDKTIDPYDITAMLVYWADQGYLKIIEEEVEFRIIFKISITNVKLEKLKDLPNDAKQFEKTFFNELFDGYAIDNIVEVKYLKNSFYITLSKVKKELIKSFKDRNFYSKEGKVASFFITFIGILILFLVFIGQFNNINPYQPGLVFVFAFFISLFIGVFLANSAHLLSIVKTRFPVEKVKTVIGAIFSSFVPLIGAIGLLFITKADSVYWVGLGLAIAIIFFAPYANKRTEIGQEWLSHILGLKQFIDSAEKNRILTLIDDDPEYFYHVLPYAMVLGVTDKWAKQFEDILTSDPDWYQSGSNRPFSTAYFVSQINSSTQNVGRTLSSSPSSSGSGGSSGGGSSGGGSGGGGGGGW
ncbi:MAG: DUF2207 domain-containing protein [Gudongella sp.]|nr:DUF2207 domain-containing protein [Gudongella sp.]